MCTGYELSLIHIYVVTGEIRVWAFKKRYFLVKQIVFKEEHKKKPSTSTEIIQYYVSDIKLQL